MPSDNCSVSPNAEIDFIKEEVKEIARDIDIKIKRIMTLNKCPERLLKFQSIVRWINILDAHNGRSETIDSIPIGLTIDSFISVIKDDINLNESNYLFYERQEIDKLSDKGTSDIYSKMKIILQGIISLEVSSKDRVKKINNLETLIQSSDVNSGDLIYDYGKSVEKTMEEIVKNKEDHFSPLDVIKIKEILDVIKDKQKELTGAQIPSGSAGEASKAALLDEDRKKVTSHNLRAKKTVGFQEPSDNAGKASENAALPDKNEKLRKKLHDKNMGHIREIIEYPHEYDDEEKINGSIMPFDNCSVSPNAEIDFIKEEVKEAARDIDINIKRIMTLNKYPERLLEFRNIVKCINIIDAHNGRSEIIGGTPIGVTIDSFISVIKDDINLNESNYLFDERQEIDKLSDKGTSDIYSKMQIILQGIISLEVSSKDRVEKINNLETLIQSSDVNSGDLIYDYGKSVEKTMKEIVKNKEDHFSPLDVIKIKEILDVIKDKQKELTGAQIPSGSASEASKAALLDEDRKKVTSHNLRAKKTVGFQEPSDNAGKASENAALPDKNEKLRKKLHDENMSHIQEIIEYSHEYDVEEQINKIDTLKSIIFSETSSLKTNGFMTDDDKMKILELIEDNIEKFINSDSEYVVGQIFDITDQIKTHMDNKKADKERRKNVDEMQASRREKENDPEKAYLLDSKYA